MPTLDDYDPNKNDTESGFGANGSSGSSSGGGALFGGASKQQETPYTPWSRFQSANSDVSNREAGKLQQQVGGDVTSAMQGLDNANAAYNKGISAQYTPPPATASADTQRASGAKPQVNSFGGANWGAFGTPAPAQGPTAGQQKGNAPSANATNPMAPAKQPPAPAGPGAQLSLPPQANSNAVANGSQGPKDLESSMSPDVWNGLTNKVTNADQEATQLGSQSGVQALLSQNSGTPATGFDAALINGAGQQGFQQAAQKFGNGVLPAQQANSEQASQNAWSQLGNQVAGQQAAAAGLPARQAADAQKASDIAGDARRNSDRNDNRIGGGPKNTKAPTPGGAQAAGRPPQISDQTKATMSKVENANPGFLKSFGIDPNTPAGQSSYQALTDWFAQDSKGGVRGSKNNEEWFNGLSTAEKKQFIDNLNTYINSPGYDGKPYPYTPPVTANFG